MTADPSPARPLRIGVDVGGTFTDLVAFDGRSLRVVKVPSTPPDFHRAVFDAVRRATADAAAAAGAGGPADALAVDVVHGSTVATNALLERKGEPVAFVTTEGFRDLLLIGRQNRPDLYALHVVRPKPLADEAHWFTVRERVDARGEVVTPIDDRQVDEVVERIVAVGLRHVAVCLLFAYVNPAHERLVADRCRRAGLTVSLSSDVMPEFREYERASTTVINAALRPKVEAYLTALESGLAAPGPAATDGGLAPSPGNPGEGWGEGQAGVPKVRGGRIGGVGGSGVISSATLLHPGPHPNPLPAYRERGPEAAGPRVASLSIMSSTGGTLSVADAAVSAARLVLSGPAGGVAGAALVAKAAGVADVITYDMGGTSTDVAAIVGGQPQWTTAGVVDGLPIGLPALDIHTVGAGGGSVAYLDPGGALRVGPRSAGAVPGPACYGRGGTEPTVTDANLVLGRIRPDRFAGGQMKVDPALARAAIGPLAAAMGKTVEEAADGIVRVAEENMSRAVRAVTSRRGLDPRGFALMSFGGAGGLHACAVAESLEVRTVIVPPYCGVLSALGMVAAPPVADASKTVLHLGEQLDDHRLYAEFGHLNMLAAEKVPQEQLAAVEAHADLRFKGQSYELTVRARGADRAAMETAFRQAYAERYGTVPEGRAVEVVTLRIKRIGRIPDVALPDIILPGADRPVTESPAAAAVPAATRREVLARGPLAGPLLIVDDEATSYVPAGWTVRAAPDGIATFVRLTPG